MSKNIYQDNGSRDRFTASIMWEIRREMARKIELLRVEQTKIENELVIGFDVEKFRALNIINHRLEVAKSRLKGEWLRGSFPQIAELSK